MTELFDQLCTQMRNAHQQLLETLDGLDDELIGRRPGGTLPNIAFHVWHTARWADNDYALITTRDEIWHSHGFSEKWDLDRAQLGEAATGTGLSDDQSASLVLPGKDALIEYANTAFTAYDDMVIALTPHDLTSYRTAPDGEQDVQSYIFDQLTHTNRHTGMIEALKGIHGLRGTATR